MGDRLFENHRGRKIFRKNVLYIFALCTDTQIVELPVSTRRSGGFTLIEILIVVIILGVLAAVVVPMFGETSNEAEINVCMENMGIIERAMDIYKLRNGEFPESTDDLSAIFPTLPACPLAGAYTWELRTSRYHIACSGQHGPEVDHICIRDTHGPNAR
jgi:prepilin-type N-terminal cleavage/methylation domain-containing protein